MQFINYKHTLQEKKVFKSDAWIPKESLAFTFKVMVTNIVLIF